MPVETRDKRPTAANFKAFWDGKFSDKDWLKKLRGKLGLGESDSVLDEDHGGTSGVRLFDETQIRYLRGEKKASLTIDTSSASVFSNNHMTNLTVRSGKSYFCPTSAAFVKSASSGTGTITATVAMKILNEDLVCTEVSASGVFFSGELNSSSTSETHMFYADAEGFDPVWQLSVFVKSGAPCHIFGLMSVSATSDGVVSLKPVGHTPIVKYPQYPFSDSYMTVNEPPRWIGTDKGFFSALMNGYYSNSAHTTGCKISSDGVSSLSNMVDMGSSYHYGRYPIVNGGFIEFVNTSSGDVPWLDMSTMELVKKASKHVQKNKYYYKTPNRWKYEFSHGVLTKTSFDSFGNEVGTETVISTFLPLGQSVADGYFIGTVDLGNDWLIVTSSGVFVADKSGVSAKVSKLSSDQDVYWIIASEYFTHVSPIDIRETDVGYRIASPWIGGGNEGLYIANIEIH